MPHATTLPIVQDKANAKILMSANAILAGWVMTALKNRANHFIIVHLMGRALNTMNAHVTPVGREEAVASQFALNYETAQGMETARILMNVNATMATRELCVTSGLTVMS